MPNQHAPNEYTQAPRSSQAAPLQARKTSSLLRGRTSSKGAAYFITLCTKNRNIGLNSPEISENIFQEWKNLHMESIIDFKCGTIMPDHIHFLFELGSTYSLPQVVSRIKTLSKASLGKIGIQWQRNYYDHRLRNNSRFETFAYYIFLNPYRKNLVVLDQPWLYWKINKHYHPQFTENLDSNHAPPAKWLTDALPINTIIQSETHHNP